MYDFYCEINPSVTYYLVGHIVRFERGKFTTNNRALAEALLKKVDEWHLIPGDWNKPGPEMAVADRGIPANPRTYRRKRNDDSL